MKRALTLIELLVVVAIIALLISILLPALSRAKEQAKITKCIANLRSVGQAMHMYFDEHNGWFPFEKENFPGVARPTNPNATPLHGFHYGGHPGRRIPEDRANWWGFTRQVWRDTPKGRPFNRYLTDGLHNRREQLAEQGTPEFEQVREKLQVFACPSDVGGYWNNQTANDEAPRPTHWSTGSSYDFNYYFVWNWASKRTPGSDPNWFKSYLERGNNFLQQQMQNHAAEFIMLLEDPFDSAVWQYIPRRGWHREWNRHSFLFLDGHAANIVANATNGHRGEGWKLAGGNDDNDPRAWWNDPDDPDYRYRTIGPRGFNPKAGQ